MKQDAPHLEPVSSTAWRRWLSANHGQTSGVWVVFRKKQADSGLLTYEQAVEDALCFGWIDSTPGKIDSSRFKVWFAPRNPKSEWSRINKARAGRLIRDGRMRPAGLAKIEEAKRNGAWSLLDAVEALEEPSDFAAALDANPAARRNYDGFPPGSRKIILGWIVRAVRPETRAKRIAEAVEKAARGIRANQARP